LFSALLQEGKENLGNFKTAKLFILLKSFHFRHCFFVGGRGRCFIPFFPFPNELEYFQEL